PPLLLRSAPDRRRRTLSSLSDLQRLPETAREVRGIAGALGVEPGKFIFTGRRANEAQVKGMDLSLYRILAFATHALMPYEMHGLEEPALALTAPEVAGAPGDGLLTVSEVRRLTLEADWVVLTGCNTGRGNGRVAEAISGLGRAFLHAGARSLLFTHWEVDSTVARMLVTDVFKRQGADKRLSPGEAMRRAKMALIDGPGYPDHDGETLFAYAHPIFWAPFALFGDGKAAAGPSQKLGAAPKN
ncbi:MAG: CHAT domain-containing protein, partial [Alphaproteobacteria bacterium]|nr:CHAT domain-containing protein [Alphaproteobacteria bacterium]